MFMMEKHQIKPNLIILFTFVLDLNKYLVSNGKLSKTKYLHSFRYKLSKN